MNQTSRTDETPDHPGWNQSPRSLNAEETTRQDLNGTVNSRKQRDHIVAAGSGEGSLPSVVIPDNKADGSSDSVGVPLTGLVMATPVADQPSDRSEVLRPHLFILRLLRPLLKFRSFIGPGFMIAVAYIDPGNYSTDVAGGAQSKYALLFIVFLSNLFAIFLQSLCIKLGSVTGLNLAENCRVHLPKWLVIILYVFAESAIIATDIAEVIGSAIALNLLLKIPLIAGCAITLVDVLFLLIFFRPDGSMTGLRAFECLVMLLVLGVVICFCIELSLIKDQLVGEVFRGYLPSATVVTGSGLYQSCGILGATVMPHSLFLGSGNVQPRLKEFDVKQGYADASISLDNSGRDSWYRPSIHAIRNCLKYSILDLTFCLFTFALFVNSAILIVAGASLYGTPGAGDADLFGIHQLLSQTISPIAGTIFALALLLSGLSAGIICTIAGQMISEGMLQWKLKPWMRRLTTRIISIIPSIIIAGAVGKDGLNAALNASQVTLSVILPFVAAPLIYFTSRNRYMTVQVSQIDGEAEVESVKMRNSWVVSILGSVIWLVISVMNVALLVLVGLGEA